MLYSTPTAFGVLPTTDAEILATTHRCRVRPVTNHNFDLGIVTAHGFSGFRDKPPVGAMSSGIRHYAGVLAPGPRNPGQPPAACTFGDPGHLEVTGMDAGHGELPWLA